MSDFSAALNNFQAVQRRAAEKEKETVARARGGSRLSVGFLGVKTTAVVTVSGLSDSTNHVCSSLG